MSEIEHISQPLQRLLDGIRKKMEAHQDRADMRADSALDPDRPQGERYRDYVRYEDEAIAAQKEALRLGAFENLIKTGFIK